MMDEHNGVLQSTRVTKLAVAFLIAATALVTVQAFSLLNNFDESPNAQQNVIVVSGEGKVSAAPDIATISFTSSSDAKTASAAQDAAAKSTNAALDALKAFKIADKDIQTSSYSVYPKYSTPTPCVYSAVVSSSGTMVVPPCQTKESTIIGYTASQSITLKVRDLDSIGDVVTALGKAGVSNINGPDFTIDNPEGVQAQARTLAIADARTQAQALAKALGVRLVRVVNYSENGGYYPRAAMMSSDSMAYGKGVTAAAPAVPTGQNEITSAVSVTYEIR